MAQVNQRFLKMLTQQESPDAGEIRVGDTVKLAYVDQMRDHLDPNKTVCRKFLTDMTSCKLVLSKCHHVRM